MLLAMKDNNATGNGPFLITISDSCVFFNSRGISTDFRVIFTCLFILVIVHPVLSLFFVASSPVVSCSTPNYGSMYPWSPIFSLYCFS